MKAQNLATKRWRKGTINVEFKGTGMGVTQSRDRWRGVNMDPSNLEDECNRFLRNVGKH